MKEPTTSTLVLAVAEIAGFSRACRHKFDVETFATLDRFHHATADVIATSGGRPRAWSNRGWRCWCWIWCKLHLGFEAQTGQVVAQTLTAAGTDEASQVRPMLE